MKKKAIGRPTSFSEPLISSICDRLCLGEAIRTICKEPNMPSTTTVFRWLGNDEVPAFRAFKDRYAKSRRIGLEMIADEMLEIADASAINTATGMIDSGLVQKQRLQIDTRKWLLSKLNPTKYGDKTALEHQGGITLTVVTGVPRSDAVTGGVRDS